MFMSRKYRCRLCYDVRSVIPMSHLVTPLTAPAADLRRELAAIEELARTIDRDGLAAVSAAAIDHVIEVGLAADVSPVLAEVLADTNEPPAVRERAFGLLAMRILARATTGHFTLAA